jgi:uncharacterized protein
LIDIVETLAGIDPQQWNELAAGDPCLSYEFLHAMHESGSACQRSGWEPNYLVARGGGRLVGAMPRYLKHHSYGEYVFDWAWADAYVRHGLEYYPKWLCALPFTPTTGKRVLALNDAVELELLKAFDRESRLINSAHVLFPSAREGLALKELGYIERHGVQFHWHNRGYASFDDFLSALSKDKRKKIKQERRYALDSGVQITHRVGSDISEADWDFFYRCYVQTYREHHSSPYLTRKFFAMLSESAPQSCLLTLAHLSGKPVAASFCLLGSPDQQNALGQRQRRMYGRYWGAVIHIPHLHFELCYYAPMQFAIENGIDVFEGGAQGEHKLSRGFDAVATRSYHWLSHPAFYEAVQAHVEREANAIGEYQRDLKERSAYRSG